MVVHVLRFQEHLRKAPRGCGRFALGEHSREPPRSFHLVTRAKGDFKPLRTERCEDRKMNLPMPRSPHALIFLSLNFSVWIRRRCTSTKEEPRNEPKTFQYASLTSLPFVKIEMVCGYALLWFTAFFRLPSSAICNLPFAIFHLPPLGRGLWSVVRGLFFVPLPVVQNPRFFFALLPIIGVRIGADHRRSRLRIRANSCQFVQFVSAVAKPRFGPSRGLAFPNFWFSR